jgi:hypothetical protein
MCLTSQQNKQEKENKQMKKLAVFAVAAAMAVQAFAVADWVGNGAININGEWYYANQALDWGDAMKGAFDGHDFGTITSLLLGGQVQVWDEKDDEPGSGIAVDWGGGTANMFYSIDNGAATPISLDYYQFSSNNNFFESRDNGQFSTTAVDISTLPDGPHTLKIYFDDSDSAATDTAVTANFTTAGGSPAVPEPATMSLLGLGALAMVLRRKLRK